MKKESSFNVESKRRGLFDTKLILKKRNLLELFVVGVFLIASFGLVSALPSIILNSPANYSSFSKGSDVNFNCSFDSDNSEISKLELLYKADYADSFSVLKTFNKGEFNEDVQGGNISTNFLNEYLVSLNPTSISKISGDATCNSVNDGCNLLNSSDGNVIGGYAQVNPGINNGYLIELNDTYLVHNFYLYQHPTQYANSSKLEYSLDGESWTTAFTQTTTAAIDYDFTTPIRAKYFKITFLDTASGNNYFYGRYLDITGQVLNSSTSFNDHLNYTYPGLAGGIYDWNCKAYTDVANITSSEDFVFIMNGTRVDWVSPTPVSGTEDTNIVINSSVISDNDAFSFFVRDNSLMGWWAFDDGVLSSVNGFGSTLTASGTPNYINTTYGQSVNLEAGEYLYSNTAVSGGSNDGFTLVFDMNLSNTSIMTDGEDLSYSNSGTGGWKLRGWSSINVTHNFLIMYFSNASGVQSQANFYYPKSVLDTYSRYAFSIDHVNQEYRMYVNGDLVSSDTNNNEEDGFFAFDPHLRISTNSLSNMTLDNLLYFNISMTDNEAKLISTYSKINTFTMDYSSDKNVSIQPYAYDNQSVLATNEIRDFNFLTSGIITYTNVFNENNTGIWAYCRGIFEGVTQGVSHVIQYSFDNLNWIDTIETYERYNDTFAVIGDSMYNDVTDFAGSLGADMGIDFADMNIYAVAGHTCTQVYNQLINNVTNGTTNLIAGCGVNGAVPETNIAQWNATYYMAKEKNISNIYMSTMPPWDTINTYNDTTANTICDRMKEQNEWLLDFAEEHDDLYVVDIWSDWHDTSGTNKTDCGWRDDIVYNGDVTHPNSAGYQYWAEKQWNESFNQWVNNTYQAFVIPNQTGDYYLRCYTNGDRPSLVSTMDTITITDDQVPSVNLTSPANGYSETSSSATINFQFNVSDQLSDIAYCSVFLDGTEHANTSAISETEINTISISSIGTGSHSWYVYCNDTLGNEANSSERSFTINVPSSDTTTTYSGSASQVSLGSDSDIFGSTTKVRYGYQYNFNFNSESHKFLLRSINRESGEVTIDVYSDKKEVVLKEGESENVDLDGDGEFDIVMTLEKIYSDSVAVDLLISDYVVGSDDYSEDVSEGDVEGVIEGESNWIYWVVGVLVLIGVGVVFWLKRK